MFRKVAPPKGINGLRIITNRHDVVMGGRQLTHQIRLETVRILVFIHQNIPVGLGNDLPGLLIQSQELLKADEQVIVIHQLPFPLCRVIRFLKPG